MFRVEFPDQPVENLIETGWSRDELLDYFGKRFNSEIDVRNNDPRAPFLWWSAFKDEDPNLARAMIRIASVEFSKNQIEAVVMLPSSMTWVGRHLKDNDFSDAVFPSVSREDFEGAEKLMITSYTKLNDGSQRPLGAPRERVPMYVDPALFEASRVLVGDDVIANGRTIEEFALALRERGVDEVFGVAGFSKNMQKGLKRLQREDSPLGKIISCVEVEEVENGKVQTKGWWT